MSAQAKSQFELFNGQQRRDEGIERAAAHAERTAPGWMQAALAHLRAWAPAREPFLAEDFREAMAGKLQAPPDGRAWGAVFRTAAIGGLLERAGFKVDKYGSPKALWTWRRTA